MEDKKMYVGSAKELPKGGISVQLDLTELWGFTQEDAKEFIKSYFDKSKKEHKTLNLEIWPLKEENKTTWRTHSVKISTYVPEKKAEAIQQPEPKPMDEIPF